MDWFQQPPAEPVPRQDNAAIRAQCIALPTHRPRRTVKHPVILKFLVPAAVVQAHYVPTHSARAPPQVAA